MGHWHPTGGVMVDRLAWSSGQQLLVEGKLLQWFGYDETRYTLAPCGSREYCRIGSPRFVAECRMRRLNQG